MSEDNDLIVGVAEIALAAGKSEEEARALIAEGKLPTFKLAGGLTASRTSMIERWLEANRPKWILAPVRRYGRDDEWTASV